MRHLAMDNISLHYDPLGILPIGFELKGKYKVVSIESNGLTYNPDVMSVVIKFSYGGTTNRSYLRVVKDYLDNKFKGE